MTRTKSLEAAGRESVAFSADREGITSARLEFPRGAARLTIRGAELTELFCANFDRPVPSVEVEEGTVSVTYPRVSPRGWVEPWRSRRGSVALTTDASWALSIRGVAHLDADLHDLAVRAIDIARGASHAEVRLPRPSGAVPFRVSGGASDLTVRYPAGTAARLRVGRGVADLRFGEQEFGAVGGAVHLATPHAGLADDRYDIEISGGAAHLWIDVDDASKEG